jgi:hypothetical protein
MLSYLEKYKTFKIFLIKISIRYLRICTIL